MIASSALTPFHASDIPVYAGRSLIIVVVLILGFRLLGKRQLGQLNLYDLAMLIAMSNVVQNAMTAGRGNFAVGLVSSATIVIAAWALSKVLPKEPALAHRLFGTPTILVNRGHVLPGRMRRERVTDEELDAALREHGLESVQDAALVVIEVDGSISVVPRSRSEGG